MVVAPLSYKLLGISLTDVGLVIKFPHQTIVYRLKTNGCMRVSSTPSLYMEILPELKGKNFTFTMYEEISLFNNTECWTFTKYLRNIIVKRNNLIYKVYKDLYVSDKERFQRERLVTFTHMITMPFAKLYKIKQYGLLSKQKYWTLQNSQSENATVTLKVSAGPDTNDALLEFLNAHQYNIHNTIVEKSLPVKL